MNDLEKIARQDLSKLSDHLANPKRELGWLQDHGVARGERRDRRCHRECERRVPWADDAHHAIWVVSAVTLLVLEVAERHPLVSQEAMRVPRIVAEDVADVEHFADGVL